MMNINAFLMSNLEFFTLIVQEVFIVHELFFLRKEVEKSFYLIILMRRENIIEIKTFVGPINIKSCY